MTYILENILTKMRCPSFSWRLMYEIYFVVEEEPGPSYAGECTHPQPGPSDQEGITYNCIMLTS